MDILERLFQPEPGYPRQLTWRMIRGVEASHLASLLEQAMTPYKIRRPGLFHAARLPFYGRAELVRWHNTMIHPEMDSYAVTDGEILIVLESERDLHRANFIGGVQLDARTALDYLRFIGSRGMWSERTPLILIESIEDVLPAAAYSLHVNLDEIRPIIAKRIRPPIIRVSDTAIFVQLTLKEDHDLIKATLRVNRSNGRFVESEAELVYRGIPTFGMPSPF